MLFLIYHQDKSHVLLNEFIKKRCYHREVLNNFFVKTGQVLKAHDFSYGLRVGPFFDDLLFLRICVNLISSNHEFQKYNVLSTKGSFLKVGKEVIPPEDRQDLFEMTNLIIKILTIY